MIFYFFTLVPESRGLKVSHRQVFFNDYCWAIFTFMSYKMYKMREKGSRGKIGLLSKYQCTWKYTASCSRGNCFK